MATTYLRRLPTVSYSAGSWELDDYNENPLSQARLGYSYKMIKCVCPRCGKAAYLEDRDTEDKESETMLHYTIRHFSKDDDRACALLGDVLLGART